MSAIHLLSGDVNRTWPYTDDLGVQHEVCLVHDPLTGTRAAMLDSAEIPGSMGSTSVFAPKTTTLPFRDGIVTITRQGTFGFSYECRVNGRLLEEVTTGRATAGGSAAGAAPAFAVDVSDVEKAPEVGAPSDDLVAWYVTAPLLLLLLLLPLLRLTHPLTHSPRLSQVRCAHHARQRRADNVRAPAVPGLRRPARRRERGPARPPPPQLRAGAPAQEVQAGA